MFTLSTWILFLLGLTGLATLTLGGYVWRQRRVPGAGPMAAVLILSGLWSLAYSAQLLNTALGAKILALKVYFTIIPLVPVAWALLGIELRAQKHWATWPRIAALSVLPAVTIALTWTVDLHPWLFPDLRVVESPPLVLLDSGLGPWFWVHTAYSYVLILFGTALLVPRMLTERGLYRWQSALLTLAPLVPLGANMVYILGITPPPRLDFTPQGFSASALFIGWAIFRYRLLDLMPIAHRVVVEGLGDEVLIFNDADHLVDLNPAARVRFPTATAGATAATVLSGWPDLAALLATPGAQRVDLELRASHGEPTWCEVRVHDLSTGPDQRAGRLLVLRDITPRKQAEAAIAHARDRAIEANELKTQILAKVSHELRTPIGALMGYAELMQTGAYGPITDQQGAAAERMIQNSKALGRLVGELLDQAQLESGRLRLRPRPSPLTAIIDAVQDALSPLARAKALTLSFALDPDLPTHLEIDPDRVQQILMNLTHNAIKFTDRGEVTVRAALDGGARWQLTVADTGCGLTPEAQGRIFDPFWQADATLTRVHGGYGLGLTIVRQLVDLMGGQIALSSTVGKGTTFTVSLPLYPPDPQT
ncbi:MAG: hypothetical protein JNL73_15915 [Anaerolineales bacterium]|nr:hypothetical protein [Anaerolineales bacterium]